MPRIALITKSRQAVRSLTDALEQRGQEVSLVHDPIVGIRDCGVVDVVILDLQAFATNGDDAIPQVRQALGVWKPIYLYADLPDTELDQRSTSMRASGYISAQWDMTRQLQTIDEALRSGQAATSNEQPGLSSEPARNSHQEVPSVVSGGIGTATIEGAAGLTEAFDRLSDVLAQQAAALEDPEPSQNPEPSLPSDDVQRLEAPLAGDSMLAQLAEICERRRQRVHAMIEHASSGDNDRKAIGALAQEFEDWFAEAQMLGYGQLANVAQRLQELVYHRSTTTFRPETDGVQLRSWTDRLAAATDMMTRSVSPDEIAQQLSELHQEVCDQMGSEEDTSAPTGDFLAVPKTCNIIVFDDSPLIRRILAKKLEANGHNVSATADHTEFERLIVEVDPDLVVLDINMPEIKGDEVCRQLRERGGDRQPTVIFLSSLTEDALSLLASQAGANGYVSKRHGVDEVLRYVEGVLTNGPPE